LWFVADHSVEDLERLLWEAIAVALPLRVKFL
jgi:hypothetical protein